MVAKVSASLTAQPRSPAWSAAGSLFQRARMRSKLDGSPTSMALDSVAKLAWGRHAPVCKYCGTTSLRLVAAQKPATGSPHCAAYTPAVRLPKLPLGTQKRGRPRARSRRPAKT